MPTISDETKRLIKDSVDVETLLVSLGFKPTRVTSNEIRATCRLHGGDNPTAFSVRLDTKKWRCFTKKCEQDAAGNVYNDLIALVMRANNVPFLEAVRYLADFAGISWDPNTETVEQTAEFRREKEIRNYVRTVGRVSSRTKGLPEISEQVVQIYMSNRDDYFLRCGFLPSTLEVFQVGAKFDGAGIRRATIPIRDQHGKLVSISARREDGDDEPRYLLDKEFQKGRVLYNLHMALLSREDTVIVVEGFKALWAVFEAGFSNAVACMGAEITDEQMLLLCTSGFVNCVPMLDGDSAGRKGMENAVPRLCKMFNTVPAYLPSGKSPDSFEDRKDLRDFLELYLLSF